MIIIEKWLKEGEQTGSTEEIKEIAKNIESRSNGKIEQIVNILKYIRDNIDPDHSNKNKEFRKRTAGEIIEDGHSTGCTDYTLAFIAIARELGIPTKYVEGIREGEEHLEEIAKGERSIKGHVVAECLVNEEWYGVDPTRGTIGLNIDRVVCGRNFVVLWKAFDSWDLDIRSLEDLRKKIKEYLLTKSFL